MVMMTLMDLIVLPHESLKAALQRMTRNHKGVLLVCDRNRRLVGVLSDGDVRRTLLDGTLMIAPVQNIMNTAPVAAKTAGEAETLLHQTGAVVIPVVDPDGRLQAAVIQEGGEIQVLQVPPEAQSPAPAPEIAKAVAVIPARGGSKRIPRKNLAKAGGKSLLSWAVHAAKGAQHIRQVVVSTNDAEIAQAARSAGAEVPWMRPEDLSRDDTPSLAVLIHALEWARGSQQPPPEFGVLLEPTAPLRLSRHIDEALEKLAETGADSVVAVCEVPHVLNPEELLVVDADRLRPYPPSRAMAARHLRGAQAPAYAMSGLVYAFRIASVLKQRSLFGAVCLPLLIDWQYFLDVDTPEDLMEADYKLRHLYRVEAEDPWEA